MMALAALRIETFAPLAVIAGVCEGVDDATRLVDLPEDVIDSLDRYIAFDLPTHGSFGEWIVMQAMDPTQPAVTVGELKAYYAS
ncbi:hypothetical protein [Luteibacter aegosomatissinici]|uniref:hypothetical protein n=1 Tax=Luteibacter aegosomatissinici TaxID=2911539 RepID=UPI001FF9FC6C|nr:hypothetical protein [Luteibacter aegosomatissinici]UPG93827.1 hypothetical protein L2Y97_18625 [Luteibacter aegosomatissinici]